MKSYEMVVMNFTPSLLRTETLEGREYLVAPTIMLVPGVHIGSQGPLFYSEEQLAKNPPAWDHKPVLNNHPSVSGVATSACSPEVIEKQRIGFLLNTKYQNALRTETWIDQMKCAKVEPRILESIKKGQIVEVSTGLYFSKLVKDGVWNSEKYIAEVQDIQPDHLAILMDEKGACSIEDGAGLLRNKDGSKLSFSDIREQIRMLLKPENTGDGPELYNSVYIEDIYPKYFIYEKDGKFYKDGYSVSKGKVSIFNTPVAVYRKTNYVPVGNKSKNLDLPGVQHAWNLFVEKNTEASLKEIKGDCIIFNKGNKIFRLAYQQTDDKINLDETPTEVLEHEMSQTTNSRTATEMFINPDQQKTAARKELVGKLIAGGSWTEEDRAFLEGLAEADFARVQKVAGSTAAATPPTATTPVTTPAAQTQPAVPAQVPTAPLPAANQAVAVEQWLADPSIPAPVRDMIRNNMRMIEAQKKELVDIIVANKQNVFTKEWLLQQDPNMLQGIVALAKSPVHNTQFPAYLGQSDVPMLTINQGSKTSNQAAAPAGLVLPMPGLLSQK